MNLIELLASEIAGDFDGDDRQATRAVQTYENGTPEQKKAIDDLMICLCGWSMKTLIEMLHERNGGAPRRIKPANYTK